MVCCLPCSGCGGRSELVLSARFVPEPLWYACRQCEGRVTDAIVEAEARAGVVWIGKEDRVLARGPLAGLAVPRSDGSTVAGDLTCLTCLRLRPDGELLVLMHWPEGGALRSKFVPLSRLADANLHLPLLAVRDRPEIGEAFLRRNVPLLALLRVLRGLPAASRARACARYLRGRTSPLPLPTAAS